MQADSAEKYPRRAVFPLDPSGAIEGAMQTRHSETIDYTRTVVTAAAALADKTMLGKRDIAAGMHTQIVSDLITPFLYDFAPAEPRRFYAYDNGEVYANWADRNANDKTRSRKLTFAGLARKKTIELADIDEDIKIAFSQGIMVQTVDSYINDMSQALTERLSSDDFPYRALKPAKDALEFWDYIINGDQHRPGLMQAAAYSELIKAQWLENLKVIYGAGASLAAQYMQVVLYMTTSRRGTAESERELLTPLIESFGSRNVSTIGDRLLDFGRRRVELFTDMALKSLGIARIDLERERDERETASNAQEQALDPAAIKSVVYGNRGVQASSHDLRSVIDQSLNNWAAANLGHVYSRGQMRLTLIGAMDKYSTGLKPHLMFAWLDKNTHKDPVVRFMVLPARQFLTDIRGRKPKVEDAGMLLPANEELAYYLLTTKPVASNPSRRGYHMVAQAMLVRHLRKLRSSETGSSPETGEKI